MAPDRPARVLREQLDAALGDEIASIELRAARVWQALAVLGVALSLFLGLKSSAALLVWGTSASLVFGLWFTVVAHILAQGRGTRALRVASSVVEGSLPWVFLAVLTRAEGPAYALGSWVPPLLFAGLVIVSTVRLRPIEPLAIGVSSGLAFLGIYFVWLRDALPPEIAMEKLYSSRVQISRAVSLSTGGALAMMVSLTLRRAIGRADTTARERELFGKYRLGRHVASGGMGTVYEAIYCPEGGFERPVAVKRIHPHLAREEAFVTFFRNEAELSARLVHPNIVQVLDFGSVEGTFFLAMELVDGLALRTLLRRLWAAGVVVPPTVAAYLTREVLSGLAYTHHTARAADGSLLKVVHRDLCPANILLSKNGEVKIADFGVARALRDADSTHTRTVAGHAGYLAPEQAMAQAIDERCDLFAIGVILWELLSGRTLFQRGAEGPTLVAVLSLEVEPPSSVRRELDPAWDSVVAQALQRAADDRFPSADAMSAAIGAVVEGRSAGADELRALVAQALALPDPPPEVDRAGSSQSDLPTQIEAKAGAAAPPATSPPT